MSFLLARQRQTATLLGIKQPDVSHLKELAANEQE
jgi:predicted XRE-type DNA-binding protein